MGGLVIFTAIAIPYLILSERDAASLAVFGVGARVRGDRLRRRLAQDREGPLARPLRADQALLPAPDRDRALVRGDASTIGLDETLNFRIFDAKVDIGGFYVVLVFLVLAGATNGVNLTDGLDGLAGGCCAIVLLAYTAMAFVTGGQDGPVGRRA